MRRSHLLLAVIVLAYLLLGVSYAIFIPTWQVPDEPAHYNYIAALAAGDGIPVLEPGDYDQALLSELTTRRFPPGLSVEPLEYEDHQPPLYYALAVPTYWLFGGRLLPLRLISVLIGAALIVVTYALVSVLFRLRPSLPPVAAALVAFIPQHVAMTAGVNNDTLGELMVAVILLLLVLYVRNGTFRPWRIGILLGFALLTKTTAYVTVGVAFFAVLLRWRYECRSLRWALAHLAWMFLPALLIALPWYVRNGLVYGWHDPLGLVRHNVIVEGQPRSVGWLAAYGWGGLLGRLFRTTFRSFWGQFGWMAVVLPARIYGLLAAFSVVLVVGFLWWLLDPRRPPLTIHQRAGLLLLLVSASFTALAFLWYNLTFVQHQGRYLFPALVPLATAGAIGLKKVTDVLPVPFRAWSKAAPFVLLALGNVLCLFRYAIPALS